MLTELRLVVPALTLLLISACEPAMQHKRAEMRWQVDTQLVVDGKLSPRGDFAALLLSDNSLEVWQTAAQRRVAHWAPAGVLPNTYLLQLSESAEHLVTASKRGVQLWHTEQSESLGSLDFSLHLGDAQITAVDFWVAPDKLVIGTSGGDIIFADIGNDSYRINDSHTGEVTQFAWDTDKILFSAGNDGQVIRWDLLNYRPQVSRQSRFRVTSLAAGKQGLVFVSDALKDHAIWDSSQQQVLGQLTFFKHFRWFRESIFAPNHDYLVTSSPKTDIHVWDLRTLSLDSEWPAEAQGLGSTIEDMAWVNASTLRTLTSDGVLQDWDLSVVLGQ